MLVVLAKLQRERLREYSPVKLTLCTALLLCVIPLPLGLEWLRPDWLLLTILFWNFFFPYQAGILTGFGWGLAKDILTGGWIGQTALSYALISYLAFRLSQRINVFPLWQQAISVGLLLGLHQLIMLWTSTLVGKTPPQFWLYWVPSVLGIVLWPWVYGILRISVRQFKTK